MLQHELAKVALEVLGLRHVDYRIDLIDAQPIKTGLLESRRYDLGLSVGHYDAVQRIPYGSNTLQQSDSLTLCAFTGVIEPQELNPVLLQPALHGPHT